MKEEIHEPVSVVAAYNHQTNRFRPKRLRWGGRDIELTQSGFCHPLREGNKLLHIFSMSDGSTAFRLRFDTETLQWELEEVSDGCAS